jgi:hypothetical protein
MSKLFSFKSTEWKEGKTAKGLRRFYRLWADKWLNVMILQNNKLFIVYANEKVNNTLVWEESKKKEILRAVEELVTGAEEAVAFEDMTQHEKLCEIGKNENIKYNIKHKVNTFGDGYDL